MYKLAKMIQIKLRNDSTNIRVSNQCFYVLENCNDNPLTDTGNTLFKIIILDALQITERRFRK